MKKRTEAAAETTASLEDRLAAVESYINKDIRKRKADKREIKRLKREAKDTPLESTFDGLDDTDNESELGA